MTAWRSPKQAGVVVNRAKALSPLPNIIAAILQSTQKVWAVHHGQKNGVNNDIRTLNGLNVMSNLNIMPRGSHGGHSFWRL